jgi:hypothetical protein
MYIGGPYIMYVVENGEDFSAKQSEITSLSNSLMLG